MATRRSRRFFTDEFKQQIVDLHYSGKPRKEIISEYDLTASAFDKWVSLSKKPQSYEEEERSTKEQNELEELRKKYTQLQYENDILRQAAVILGRKTE